MQRSEERKKDIALWKAGEDGGAIVAAGPPEAIAKAKASLTGTILKGVLAAGPREERPRFDPRAAARRAIAEVKAAREQAGPEAATPWEKDGRRWHTVDRVGRSGKPARWSGEILERVVERIEQIGGFPAVDWTQRAVVKVAAPSAGAPEFLQAQTGHEWVLTLRFAVKRNAFKAEALAKQLGLAPFHEAKRPVLSDAERVVLGEPRGCFQEVTIACHALEEVATDAFDAFLVKAAVSYLKAVQADPIAEIEAALLEAAPGWKVVKAPGPSKSGR